MFCLGTQLCLTRREPADCSPPGSSVHGILQASILEWAAVPSSRGTSNPGTDPTSLDLQENSLPSEPPGNKFNQRSEKMQTQRKTDKGDHIIIIM